MYKHLFTIILVLLLGSTNTLAQQFTFSGKISGGADAWVFLSYQNGEKKLVRDSCRLQDETFSFKGNINEPTRSNLMLKAGGKNSFATVYLEPAANITATGNADKLDQLTISGSKTQHEYQLLQSRLDVVNNEFAPTSAKTNVMMKAVAAAKKDKQPEHVIDSLSTILDSLKKLREPAAAKYEAVVRWFVIMYPNSYISPTQMNVYTNSWPLDTVKSIYSKFSAGVQNSLVGLQIKNTIAKREADLLAKPGFNFTGMDASGKKISLNDFKGRYVLLDFWGSWCIPCREGTPHLKELFAKYHKTGLDVIAIACNDTPEDWKKAIKKDGTGLWYNMMQQPRGTDTKGTDINDEYNVHLFPTKILIDKTGTIIARFSGTGDEAALDKKLAELF
ncbi:MAG: TlpA disulfide reductase family protein [Bacteroidota bacterium]